MPAGALGFALGFYFEDEFKAFLADAGELWSRVRVDHSPPAESMMYTFTQNPTSVCVEQDDLDALNVLYPTCQGTVRTPQCFKSQQVRAGSRCRATPARQPPPRSATHAPVG